MGAQGNEAEHLSAVVLRSLDAEDGAGDLARQAYHSRSHFYRLFSALLEETPGVMRRRLLLERAAWRLGRSTLPVTEVAFEANYGSLEAFTRAFRKAFGVSPSIYRRMGATHFHLPASNGFHFCAPGFRSKGAYEMDLFDRFNGSDSWHTRRLLEYAQKLSDDQLDRPLAEPVNLLPWHGPDRSLRELLDRIIQTREVWTAAVTGGAMPELDAAPAKDRTPAGMLERLGKADAAFNRVLENVRDRGAWDDTFVDALCEPPETFTFGGMFTHVITFNTYRRLAALEAMRRMGIGVEGLGCPMEFETQSAMAAK